MEEGGGYFFGRGELTFAFGGVVGGKPGEFFVGVVGVGVDLFEDGGDGLSCGGGGGRVILFGRFAFKVLEAGRDEFFAVE